MNAGRKIDRLLTGVIIFCLTIYKKILSPLLPQACRFYPTCSQYSVEALKKHGLVKGLWLSIKRLVRCNPFCKGGYDPVP